MGLEHDRLNSVEALFERWGLQKLRGTKNGGRRKWLLVFAIVVASDCGSSRDLEEITVDLKSAVRIKGARAARVTFVLSTTKERRFRMHSSIKAALRAGVPKRRG